MLTTATFADNDSSTVYISGNFMQGFKNFSFDSFVKDFGSDSDYGQRYDFSAGYRLGTKLKIEAQYLIIDKLKNNTQTSGAECAITGILANLIYDFWDMETSLATPFISLGAGLSSPDLKLNINDLKQENSEKGLSWQLQFGVTVKIYKQFLLQVKYSYLSIPGINFSLEDESVSSIKDELEKGVQAAGIGIVLLL
jgi:opacity protein-like surface antigen